MFIYCRLLYPVAIIVILQWSLLLFVVLDPSLHGSHVQNVSIRLFSLYRRLCGHHFILGLRFGLCHHDSTDQVGANVRVWARWPRLSCSSPPSWQFSRLFSDKNNTLINETPPIYSPHIILRPIQRIRPHSMYPVYCISSHNLDCPPFSSISSDISPALFIMILLSRWYFLIWLPQAIREIRHYSSTIFLSNPRGG